MKIQYKLKEIISYHAGIDPAEINPDDNMVILGIDDMCMTEIAMEIEETFGITIPEEDYPEITDTSVTVVTLTAYVRKKRKERNER